MSTNKSVLLVYLSLRPGCGIPGDGGCSASTLKLSRDYYENEVLPPLGLMYLSSSLKADGWDVTIFDQRIHGERGEKIESIIQLADSMKPACLGFYSDEFLSKKVAFYVKKLTSVLPVPVVVGGPGWLNYSLFLENGATAVCVGEGEETIKEMAACFLKGKDIHDTRGIYINDNGSYTSTSAKSTFANLDDILFPDYDAVPLKRYFNLLDPMSQQPLTTMITSRGCPFRCSYCVVPVLSSGRIRHRSPENVIEEIKYLLKFHQIKYINFYDEIFGWKNGWIEKFCDFISTENLRFRWSCYIYPNSFKKTYQQILRIMKAAGLVRVNVGIQSLDNNILKSINRETLDFEYISRFLRFAKKMGIFTSVDFIIGQPGDTIEKMYEAVDYADRSGVHKINVNTIKIMYGSQLYQQMQSGEKALDYTDEELNKIEKSLYKRFFLDYRNMCRTLFIVLLKNPKWFVRGIKLWKLFLMDIMRLRFRQQKT